MRITSDRFSTIKFGIIGTMILVIVAITVPGLLRAGGAEEASAIGALKTLNLACAEYSTTFETYPSALSDLQKGPDGGISSTAADLIDSSFATGTKDGYVFTYVRGETGAGYSISARPEKTGQAGARHFFTDQSGTIRYATGQDADISGAPVR